MATWAIGGFAYVLGHEPIRLKIESVDFGHLRARDVSYGEALFANAVETEFTLDSIFAGKVSRLDVEGLCLTLQFAEDGVALAGLSPATVASKSWPLPFATLQVRGVEATLRSAAGDAVWRGNLRLQPAESGGQSLTLVGMLATPRGEAPLDAVGTVTSDPVIGRVLALAISAGSQTPGVGFGLTGRLQALWTGGALGARFAFERAWAASGENRLVGMKGNIELSTGRGGLQRLTINAGYDSIGTEGIALAPGRIALTYEAGALDASVELGWGKSRGRINAHGRVDDPDAPLLLDGEAALLAGDALAIAGLEGEASGRIEFRLAAALSDPRALLANPGLSTATARTAFDRLRGRVDLAVAIEHAALAQVGAGLDMSGRLIAQIDDQGLRLEINEGLIATAETLSEALLDALPNLLRPALVGPQALALGGADARPTTFTWLRVGETYELALNGTARLHGQFADMSAEAAGRLTLDAALQPQAIAISDASLVVNELWLNPAGMAAELHVKEFSGTADAAHGGLQLEAMLIDLGEPGFALDEASLALDGELNWRQGRLEFAPSPGGRIALRGMGWADRLYVPGSMELQLAVGANAVSFIPASGELRYAVTLAPFSLSGRALMPNGVAANLDLIVPSASVQGNFAGDHSLLLRDARLDLSRPDLRAQGIDLDFNWNAATDRAVLTAKELRDASPAPLLAPVTLRADAVVGDGRLSYTAQFSADEGRAAGAAEGTIDIASGRGETQFKMDPLKFSIDGMQPAHVFPSYGRALADVSGAMELAGGINWGGGGAPETRARITLHTLALSADGARVSELNGPIDLASLAPLVTAQTQRMTGVLSLDGRVPTGFDVSFRLPESGLPVIERLSVEIADGTLMAEPFTLDPKNLIFDVALLDLDLAELGTRLGVEGLLTNARVSGHATLHLGPTGLTIADGELSSVEPGFLHYGGPAIAAQYRNQPETVARMMQALDGFDFDGLTLAWDKPPNGSGTLRAELAGVNPAVLDGQPFELELVLRTDYAPLTAVAGSLRAAATGFLAWPRASVAH
ncbi:MAG: hypothetical protein EXQ88_02440 [Alphaproteobacteria bacterium]|nr:hypothetical protein [Alphaproteobacteria bacterium]